MNKVEDKNRKQKRILVITRVSTDKQKANTSTDSQLAWAKKVTKELNGKIVKIISAGMSGQTFLKEHREEIINTIKKEKIDYLLVYKIDRFTRNLSQGTQIMNEILKLGCKIKTNSEEIDESTDLLLPHIEMAVSEHNRKTIVERGSEGTISLLKQEKYPFKYIPIGMKVVSDKNRSDFRKIYFDHSSKDLISDLFYIFLKEKSYASTARKINELYVRKLQKPLSRNRVKNALSNQIYIGFIQYMGKRYGKKGSDSEPNPSLKVIDEETFESAQKIIQRIKGKRSKNVTPLKDTLGSLVQTYGFDMVINKLDKILLIRCPKCGNIKLDRNGPEIYQGHLLQKYHCTNKKCDHQFRFPSVKQLKHLRSMDPRRCPHCGSANDLTIKQSFLSDFFIISCNKCQYEWLGSESDSELMRLFRING